MTVENISIDVKTNAGNAASQFRSLSEAIRSVSNATSSVRGANSGASSSMNDVSSSARSAASSSKSAARAIDDVSKSAKKAQAPMGSFAASLKRIAYYRLLRTILKEIAQALKEGLENVYAWSKAGGDMGQIAGALDRISSAGAQLKNQLGAAFGELLAALEPVIVALINLLTQLAQALTWVIALLSGQGYYPVAKQITKDWKEAKGAASAYKNTILGFDEINRLNDEGGGGGGTGIGSDLFDYKPLEFGLQNFFDKTYEWLSKFKDDVDSGIGKIRDFVAELLGVPELVPVEVAVKVPNAIPEPLLALQSMLASIPVVDIEFAVLGNPIPLLNTIRAAIVNLVASSPYLVAINSFVEDPVPAIEAITQNAESALEALAEKFQNAYDAMAQTVQSWVVTYAEASAAVSAETISIYDDVNSFVERTKERLSGWAMAVTETIETTFATVAESVTTALDSAKTNVEAFVTSTWDRMSQWATNTASVVSETFTSIAENAYRGLQSAADNVVAFAQGAVNAIYGWATSALSATASWARNFVKNISSAFQKAWEKVKGFAEALGAHVPSYSSSYDEVTGITTVDMTGSIIPSINLFPFMGGSPIAIPAFAEGGFPTPGDLFIANERGAELVGSMNGKPAVANNQEIVAGIAAGNVDVVNAVYAIGNMIVKAVNEIDPDITLDGQSLADKMYRYNQQAATRYGAAMVT